ncbi:MAG: DUF1189 family protein [Holophagae bacterium]|nr:DUF1189 family protein [Holophagae bacterium]
MESYNIFIAPFFSFFHKDFYREVGKNWKGKIFGYLILLQMFCWALVCLHLHTQFSAWIQNEAPKIINQIPHITIVDGEASTDVEQPYTITDPFKSGRVLFVIDTTGAITELDDSMKLGLMTRDHVYFRQQNSLNEVRVYDLSKIDRFELDAAKVSGWADLLRKWMMLAFFPFAVLGAVLYRLFIAVIYSLIGLLINAFLTGKADFGQVYRVSIMAMTPVILLKLVKNLTGIHIPMFWGICVLITLFYLAFGLFALKNGPSENEMDAKSFV